MRKYLLALLLIPMVSLAQTETLPRPGITPSSPFYFLDKLGEALQEFLTSNPEAKARLQIAFAAERVSEIKIILESKGVEAKGLKVAEQRLESHLARASEIVETEKIKGNDVSELANELDDDFRSAKKALEESFKAAKRELEDKKDVLKDQIEEARKAGDSAKVESLNQELQAVKEQKKLLERKHEEQEEVLEREEEKIEREMEDKEEAEEAIREAEEEKQEVIDDAQAEGVSLPQGIFAKFDRLLAQAIELFQRGNYQGAEQLAEQAEGSLEEAENLVEKESDEDDDVKDEEDEEDEEDED